VNPKQRAAALGLGVGLAHTLVVLFVVESVTGGFPTATADIVLGTLVSNVVSLAVVPGLPLYAAWQTDAGGEPPPCAALGGVGAGVAVAVSYPLVTAASVGAPFAEALGVRLVGPYLVNALSPAAYSAVAALAGFLLAGRNA